jgi:hypothetical protein
MSDPTLDRVYTGFDFKFFAQSTVWAPGDLVKQIASDTWFCAHVSKEVLFKSRTYKFCHVDRLRGTKNLSPSFRITYILKYIEDSSLTPLHHLFVPYTGDRMGTQRAKPLWTEIMELMGGEYQDVRDKLYKNP